MLTIAYVKNLLFSHFLSQTTFDLKSDLASIKFPASKGKGVELDSNLADKHSALVRAALDDFVKDDMLVELEPKGSGLYILRLPLDSFTQTVEISPGLAEMIADLINGFGEAQDRALGSEDEEEDFEGEARQHYQCDRMNLSERDIAIIVHICHSLINDIGDGK